MGRPLNRLSPAGAKHAKPGMHADGGGLYLQCTAGADDSVSRSWIFRWVVGTGKQRTERKMGLGSLVDVGPAAAREKAAECRRLRSEGIDPLRHREAQKAKAKLQDARAMTFDQAAKRYIDAHKAGWKNDKHQSQWTNTLKTYASPVIGGLPVADVDTALVLKALQQPVGAGNGKEQFWLAKPETASRVRGRIEKVLGWAKAQGLRTGDNPAAWEILKPLLPARADVRAVKHHEAMPYRDLPAFMAELRQRGGISARALEFTILSCLRTSEGIEAPWTELEAAADDVWAIQPARMKGQKKNRRSHRVPLTKRMVKIVEEMKAIREGEYVFPGAELGRPLSNMAMLELLRDMRPGLTVHGFRSAFKDWAVERTTFPDFVSEVALAHVSGDKVRAAYQRSDLLDLRRRLAEAWGSVVRRRIEHHRSGGGAGEAAGRRRVRSSCM